MKDSDKRTKFLDWISRGLNKVSTVFIALTIIGVINNGVSVNLVLFGSSMLAIKLLTKKGIWRKRDDNDDWLTEQGLRINHEQTIRFNEECMLRTMEESNNRNNNFYF